MGVRAFGKLYPGKVASPDESPVTGTFTDSFDGQRQGETVVIAAGHTFALAVTDRNKASTFFSGNPDFVDSSNGFLETTVIGKAYNNAIVKLKDKYSGTELNTYVLAHAGTGIQVLWKEDSESGFTALKIVDENGTIFIIKCK